MYDSTTYCVLPVPVYNHYQLNTTPVLICSQLTAKTTFLPVHNKDINGRAPFLCTHQRTSTVYYTYYKHSNNIITTTTIIRSNYY